MDRCPERRILDSKVGSLPPSQEERSNADEMGKGSGAAGNADKLTTERANKLTANDIDLTVPSQFQPSTYKFLNSLKPFPAATRSRINLERARATLKVTKKEISDSQVWLKCRTSS